MNIPPWIIKLIPSAIGLLAASNTAAVIEDPSKLLLERYAMEHVGLPYRWGGDDPVHGYDCSGLVLELLKSVGVVEPSFDTTAEGLYNMFKAEHTEKSGFGVLAFYGSQRGINHVAFCLNERECIEAGGGTHVVTSDDSAARNNAFIRIRPIRYRKDFVGFRYPKYPWRGSI